MFDSCMPCNVAWSMCKEIRVVCNSLLQMVQIEDLVFQLLVDVEEIVVVACNILMKGV